MTDPDRSVPGQLQTVEAPLLEVRVVVPPVKISLKSHMYALWIRVSARSVRRAKDARDQAIAVGREDPSFAGHIADELYESLVAICSASFAIDALYGVVADLVAWSGGMA
jgi:hypothetical protein